VHVELNDRLGIKSSFSCPYNHKQDYAEGYLGWVTTMASFAMVFGSASVHVVVGD
jgi:hypothetical protein